MAGMWNTAGKIKVFHKKSALIVVPRLGKSS